MSGLYSQPYAPGGLIGDVAGSHCRLHEIDVFLGNLVENHLLQGLLRKQLPVSSIPDVDIECSHIETPPLATSLPVIHFRNALRVPQSITDTHTKEKKNESRECISLLYTCHLLYIHTPRLEA